MFSGHCQPNADLSVPGSPEKTEQLHAVAGMPLADDLSNMESEGRIGSPSPKKNPIACLVESPYGSNQHSSLGSSRTDDSSDDAPDERAATEEALVQTSRRMVVDALRLCANDATSHGTGMDDTAMPTEFVAPPADDNVFMTNEEDDDFTMLHVEVRYLLNYSRLCSSRTISRFYPSSSSSFSSRHFPPRVCSQALCFRPC